jgi:hypothetical protein
MITNEEKIRGQVAERMFPGWEAAWRDDEIDTVRTMDEFREAIALDGILVYSLSQITVVYEDGGLFGGHGISATISPDGQFIHEPNIFG